MLLATSTQGACCASSDVRGCFTVTDRYIGTKAQAVNSFVHDRVCLLLFWEECMNDGIYCWANAHELCVLQACHYFGSLLQSMLHGFQATVNVV